MQTNRCNDVSVTEPPSDDQLRANVYSLLARLLAAPPEEELLAQLRQIETRDDSAEGIEGAWHMLRLNAQNARADAVDDEYHALFIGVGRGELMPFASWYMTGFLMDKPLAYLREDLKQLGIARRDDVKEPEDHAAALCESMALIINAGEATGLATQKTFFDNHIAPWMGAFFDDLEKADSASFYRAVARLGRELIGFEREYLSLPA